MIDASLIENCDCGWTNASNGETLDDHNWMEHNNYPYDILAEAARRCPDCGRVCKSIAGLTRHMNAIHLKLSPSQLKQKAKYEEKNHE